MCHRNGIGDCQNFLIRQEEKRPWEAPEGWCPQIWVFEAQKSSNLCPEIWVFEGRFLPSWDKLGRTARIIYSLHPDHTRGSTRRENIEDSAKGVVYLCYLATES
jgi:hypothetical protein